MGILAHETHSISVRSQTVGSEPCLCHLLAASPQEGCLPFLCFNLLFYTMEIITVATPPRDENVFLLVKCL